MLDIGLLREDPAGVAAALAARMDDDPAAAVASVLESDAARRSLLREVEAARGERKRRAAEIGRRRAAGEDIAEARAGAAALGDRVAALQAELAAAEEELRERMLALPNLPDPRTPVGGKEANRVVRVWGERPEPVPEPRDHMELTAHLGLVDHPRGTRLGGSGHWLYTGRGAVLEWALLDFFVREHLAAGDEFVLPPHLLTEENGYAAGHFPKFREDVYHLAEDGRFLLPTAETALLNIHRGDTFDEAELPRRLFAYTPCYRREAGAHRSEERGTIRGHQFNKVELFRFAAPGQAEEVLAELTARAEGLMQRLGLHHRVSLLASRDASASMRLTYDIEVWIPSLGGYKEVSSVSWAGDYQARRANIRYRPAGAAGRRTEFVHTLNASGLATSRLLPALVEQFQRPDGSVAVPEALRGHLGTDVLRP